MRNQIGAALLLAACLNPVNAKEPPPAPNPFASIIDLAKLMKSNTEHLNERIKSGNQALQLRIIEIESKLFLQQNEIDILEGRLKESQSRIENLERTMRERGFN